MGHTVHAWLESEDRSGAATGIAAIADTLITTSGDNLRLKKPYTRLALMYAWSESATYYPTECYLSIPGRNEPLWLRKGIGLNFKDPTLIFDFRDVTLDVFKAGDNLTVSGYEVDEAGVAHALGVAIIVCDGDFIPKVPSLPITHIQKCTAAACTDETWSTLALTEINALPAGKYKMLGARVENAAGFAARFIVPNYAERPATIPSSLPTDGQHKFASYWGKEYDIEMPDGLPKLEMLATGTGTSVIELYLHKVGYPRASQIV